MELKRLEMKSDTRGSLVEAFKLSSNGQVFYIIVNPRESRGNHYHLRKTETFLVIYGSAVMRVKDRVTGHVITTEVNGTDPMSMKVVPNNTHMLTATAEGAIAIVWCNEQFNENDPDTYMEEI